MNPLYIGLGVVAALLVLVVIYLATKQPVRAAVKQAVAAPLGGPVLAPSHEQLLARLVTPAFEDAVDKKRAKRLYDSMLEAYVEQRHPGEVEAEPPAATVPKPPAAAKTA